MSQQGDRHASLLTALGAGFEEYDYNSAFHAYWDSLAIAQGNFNERMLLWINDVLSASHTNVNDAMQAYAEAKGALNWSSLGDLGLP